MTERGLPIVDGAPACPFVAFDDARDDRSDRPDPRHRCYAESPPAPRARAHQDAYCLSANFPVCPTFQDWARREAARVTASAAGGSPAERLRDVPAQREAGARPPAFGPDGAAGSAAAAGAGLGALDALGGPGGPKSTGPTLPPATPAGEPGEAMIDRAIGSQKDAPEADRGQVDGDPGLDAARDPWDLPPRRPTQPEWAAPPPWAPPRSGAAADGDDVVAPDFLRTGPPPERGGTAPWTRPDRDDDDDEDDTRLGGNDPDSPAGREATMARLRALGIGEAGVAQDAAGGGYGPGAIPGGAAPVERGVARPVGAGRSSIIGASPGAQGATGIAAGAAAANGGGRSRGGLAKWLGWDRRPRVGSARPAAARRPEKEPAWERPRRFEAYPTLKTRVGVPLPSRLLLAVGAIVVAALILFFVPPLFLKQSGAASPGATRTPAASGSGAGGSARASVAASSKPAPTQLTYTVKPGDTLSSIAKKFKVTIEQILAVNKTVKNPDRIAIGTVLVIPSVVASDVVDGGASASP